MTSTIEVTIDAIDAEASAAFWQRALGYERRYRRDPFVVLGPPRGDARPIVVIQQVDAVVPEKTPVHVDLRVDDPDAEVERLRGLGASVRVVDETHRGSTRWTTMADPLGTLFCVCPSRPDLDETNQDHGAS
jgi:catechol 2,3-dioxygenase-like lactoylglutathione lyase family enzyme